MDTSSQILPCNPFPSLFLCQIVRGCFTDGRSLFRTAWRNRSIIWIISMLEGKGSRKDNSRHEEMFNPDHLKIWENLRGFRRNIFYLLSLTMLFRSTVEFNGYVPLWDFTIIIRNPFPYNVQWNIVPARVSETPINIARLMIITGSNDSTVDDTRALWFTFPSSLCTLNAIMFKRCQPILLRERREGKPVHLSFRKKRKKDRFCSSTRFVFPSRFSSNGFSIFFESFALFTTISSIKVNSMKTYFICTCTFPFNLKSRE